MTTLPPVLRDRVRCALTADPLTTAQLADLAGTGGSGYRQVFRALEQLEAGGLARRQPGRPTQSGREPTQWTAAR